MTEVKDANGGAESAESAESGTYWLTVTQVAKRLGVSRNYVYALINMGELPAKKFGPQRTRVREVDLDRGTQEQPSVLW
jgi:excisionase family DNA binding protein